MEAPPKQEEPLSTFYQYIPTEPVILSPQVEVADPKQEKLDQLERIVSDQNKLLEYLLAKLK
jgi:hypothetical protein